MNWGDRGDKREMEERLSEFPLNCLRLSFSSTCLISSHLCRPYNLVNLYASYFLPPSLPHPPLLLTVQTLSRELLMTHAVDEVSLIDVVRMRNLNLHSCASGSPLVPNCCAAGCVDCHCGNGGVHGDEGDGNDGWGILGWCSKGSATPEDEFTKQKFKKRADGFPHGSTELFWCIHYSSELEIGGMNEYNQKLLSYLFQGQVVGGSALSSTPSLRPLPCVPSMLGGER